MVSLVHFGLNVSGKFNNLRGERRIENPSSAHRDFRSTALAAGEIDLDANVTCLDTRNAHGERQRKRHH